MNAAMIDPSARVEAGAAIGSGVTIGPYCTVGPHVKIGDGCRLLAHVNVTGHTSIGPRTVIHPFASLGSPPQSVHYRGGPTKLVVGADCDIRENVTMNTGTEDGAIPANVLENIRPMAIDKVYYDDFCSLSRWAQSVKATDGKIDFKILTDGAPLKAINPKLVDAPPPPC